MSTRTYEVALPNGEVATRRTGTKVYAFATVTEAAVERWSESRKAAEDYARTGHLADKGAKVVEVVELTAEVKASRWDAALAVAKAATTKATRKAAGTKNATTKTAATTEVAVAGEAVKVATGPRGELLDRKGVLIEDGALAGYIVVLPFREFETLKVTQANRDSVPVERRWLTRCVAHGTTTPAANGTEAERQGARKARAGWCKACAKAAK